MQVREIMISLSDCAQVSQDHSLQAAIIMLSAVRRRFQDAEFRPRFLLVNDDQYQIIGVLRDYDIFHVLAKSGSQVPLRFSDMIANASRIPVREAMTPYGDSGCIGADTAIEEAIEKMMSGSLRHLLVKENAKAIGIVRLSEIFALIRRHVSRVVSS